MKDPLNGGSSEGDDMILHLGGAVGPTPLIGFHFFEIQKGVAS